MKPILERRLTPDGEDNPKSPSITNNIGMENPHPLVIYTSSSTSQPHIPVDYRPFVSYDAAGPPPQQDREPIENFALRSQFLSLIFVSSPNSKLREGRDKV